MENYDLTKICYLCLSKEENLNNIMLEDEEGIPYMDKIEFLISSNLMILQTTNTYTLCNMCLETIDSFVVFKRNCLENNRRLKYFLNEKDKENFANTKAEEKGTSLDEIRKEIQDIIDIESEEETIKEEICNKSLKKINDNETNVQIIDLEEDNSETEESFLKVNRYECVICFKSYKQKKRLQRHLEYHEKMDKMKSFECKICKTLYNEKEAYIRHIQLHLHEHVKCSYCERTYASKYLLLRHEKSHSFNVFMCHNCNKAYATRKYLNVHKKYHCK